MTAGVELLLIKYQKQLGDAIKAFRDSKTEFENRNALLDILHCLSCQPTIDGALYNAVDEILNEIVPERQRFWSIEISKEELERSKDWQKEKDRILSIIETLKDRGLAL